MGWVGVSGELARDEIRDQLCARGREDWMGVNRGEWRRGCGGRSVGAVLSSKDVETSCRPAA